MEYTGKLYDYQRQYMRALEDLWALREYAAEIGCEVGEGAMFDCITVPDAATAELLNTKWKEIANERKKRQG